MNKDYRISSSDVDKALGTRHVVLFERCGVELIYNLGGWYEVWYNKYSYLKPYLLMITKEKYKAIQVYNDKLDELSNNK